MSESLFNWMAEHPILASIPTICVITILWVGVNLFQWREYRGIKIGNKDISKMNPEEIIEEIKDLRIKSNAFEKIEDPTFGILSFSYALMVSGFLYYMADRKGDILRKFDAFSGPHKGEIEKEINVLLSKMNSYVTMMIITCIGASMSIGFVDIIADKKRIKRKQEICKRLYELESLLTKMELYREKILSIKLPDEDSLLEVKRVYSDKENLQINSYVWNRIERK